MVEGPRKQDTKSLTLSPYVGVDTKRPILRFGTRIYLDESQMVHILAPEMEPKLVRRPSGFIVRRLKREILAGGDCSILWSLFRSLDGRLSVKEILDESGDDRYTTSCLIHALKESGLLDDSGRNFATTLHAWTKKGVLPGGHLDIENQLLQVTDGNYRSYPKRKKLVLRGTIPDSLVSLQKLTRKRRSYRDFNGLSITRAELEGILTTACAVTGNARWNGRELKLRAYPSSGALYAVEIYPIALRVRGMKCGIFHFRPSDGILETLDRRPDPLIDAALPSETEMLRNIAMMVCLTANFPRHELKYGEGGYRMMVAEAGHISQNLILAATALGLSARPFGGVFDELVNQALGLDTDEEQFLLSVIIGHADGKR